MRRPAPEPDAVTAPFWQAADQGHLVIQRCDNCGTYHHPPVAICWKCLSTEFRFVPASGQGSILSFTVCQSGARHPFFRSIEPYTLALIQLDEHPDLLMLSNLPAESTMAVEIGARVSVRFETAARGRMIPQFSLIEAPKPDTDPYE